MRKSIIFMPDFSGVSSKVSIISVIFLTSAVHISAALALLLEVFIKSRYYHNDNHAGVQQTSASIGRTCAILPKIKQ